MLDYLLITIWFWGSHLTLTISLKNENNSLGSNIQHPSAFQKKKKIMNFKILC